MTPNRLVLIGAGVGLVAAVAVVLRGRQLGESVGRAAVGVADGVVSGVVKGTGALIGIPDTNLTECERAKREGRTLDASFACPAGDFLKHLFE